MSITGADENAKKIGLEPISSGARTEDEGLYPIQHGYWLDTMRKAVAAEASSTTTGTTEQGNNHDCNH